MPRHFLNSFSGFCLVFVIVCGARELSAGFVCLPGVPGTPSTNVGPNPGSNTTFSVSTTCSEQVTTTNLTRRVDQFATELRARLQGGPLLLDQTFAAPFTDPAVQSALASAQKLLTVQGAKGFVGPSLLSNNTMLSGSNTVAGAIQTAPLQTFVTVTTTVGGGSVVGVSSTAIVQIGDIGQCLGFDAAGVPFGCDPKAGNPVTIVIGSEDVKANVHTAYFLGVTNTTTNTFLTSQVYELDGVSAPVSGVPEPGTLALAGIAIPGLWLGLRFRRRREMACKLGGG